MPPTPVKVALADALGDLSKEDFEKFCFRLLSCREEPRVRRNRVEDKSRLQVVDVLVSTFTEAGALRKTVEILREIGCNEGADELEKETSGQSSKPGPSDTAGASAGAAGVKTMADELFADKHRDKLIHSVKNISPVLDGLLSHDVITKESYDEIMAIPDCEGKMRTLLCGPLESSGVRGKRIFYKILNDNEPHLIEELKRPEHEDKVQFSHSMVGSVIVLLLETLADLNESELENFRVLILQQIYVHGHLSGFPFLHLNTTDIQGTVFLFVETFGRQAVEKAKEVLKMMGRTDLVQRLSGGSSGATKKQSAEEHMSALGNKVAKMVAVKELILETLKDLSYKDQNKFELLLQFTLFQRSLPSLSWEQMPVDLLVEMCGQQAVDVVREVFMDMNRNDLVQKLSEASAGSSEKHSMDGQWPVLIQEAILLDNSVHGQMLESNFYDFSPLEKHSADKHHSALIHKVSATTAVEEVLSETLNYLSYEELKKFRWMLQLTCFQKNLPQIPWTRLMWAESAELLAYMMVSSHGQQSAEVAKDVFMDMNRTDLAERLLKRSTGHKEEQQPRLFEKQDSSEWTKLEPEVNSSNADEAPTYSIQCEAGSFECSVSGLRWVCKEKVSFKYKFCSWGDHMERIESLKYMPAGPLMDIKVIAGKLFEVYLPHWICIDAPPGILDKFAVLHIDDCGDAVEKASEVTQSHVKLSEPVFSPRAVLMKAGFPVKISCNVLIYYQPNTAFLKLHVYLIPHDSALQQTVDKMEFSKGYDIIRKPRPDKYLKMQNGFTLTADIDTAKILPEKITLRYDSQDPNFYEVFIENLDRNFHLTLSHLYTKKNKQQSDPVWTREIRKDDYKNSGRSVEKLSADEHLPALLQAATIRTDAERLLETLQDLNQDDFKEFKWHLQKSDRAGFPESRLEKVDRVLDLVDVMLQTYNQQSVEETKKVLKKMSRNDLVQKLSDTRGKLVNKQTNKPTKKKFKMCFP
ncbi:hypothetical protein L3Q82_013478 [Scortum barcoo]|uniref:Uncharacterized protein n=1 Tax=Scortum barcoo TaxID=214431 RepID=A0ACB8W0P3_9TELE|nr:hypothetical protein L3Q82_013478 [Scortum barcoo]